MENWTLSPRVFAVRRNFVTKSLVQTQRHFWLVSRNGRIPSRSATLKWIHDFNVHDSVSNRLVGPTRTVHIPEYVESLRYAVQLSPARLARRLAHLLCISSRIPRRILHEEFKSHPYKIQVTHELKEWEEFPESIFSTQFLEVWCDIRGVMHVLMVLDAVHFNLLDYIGKQNFR